jgi:hypothetical protein
MYNLWAITFTAAVLVTAYSEIVQPFTKSGSHKPLLRPAVTQTSWPINRHQLRAQTILPGASFNRTLTFCNASREQLLQQEALDQIVTACRASRRRNFIRFYVKSMCTACVNQGVAHVKRPLVPGWTSRESRILPSSVLLRRSVLQHTLKKSATEVCI